MLNKNLIIFGMLVIFVLAINTSSANFVCGNVIDDDNLSANWLKVRVWYSLNISDVINCTVNSENKFCCDLDEARSTKFSVGKSVSAEIFKESEGYVSNVVSLVTTSDSYVVFPEIKIKEAIKVVNRSSLILINKSEINLSVSLAEGYTPLSYILETENSKTNNTVCTNCSNANVSVPIDFGKNKITLITSGRHIVKKEIIFYNLEYLNITREITCDTCENNQNIPVRENITMIVRVNASHFIQGEVQEFYPFEFSLLSENYTEYSDSHNFFTKEINSSYLEYKYLIRAPSVIIPRKYIFKTQLDGFSKSNIMLVHKNWFSLYLSSGFIESEWLPNKFFKISEIEPLVIKDIDTNVVLIAVFPKEEELAFYRILQKESSSGGKDYKVLTNIPEKNIDRIFVRFVSDNITELSLLSPDKINLTVYESDGIKTYEGYINNREFTIE